MNPAPAQPERARGWAAVGAIAATYGYFLIFAEFALLELVRAVDAAQTRAVLGALGSGGVAGAVLAASVFAPSRLRPGLVVAFGGCGVSAAAATVLTTIPALMKDAALAGVSLGALTVFLASGLSGWLGRKRLGLGIGCGTGAAYAVCNVPAVFEASPVVQAWGGALAALMGIGCAVLLRSVPDAERAAPLRAADFSTGGMVRWIVLLLALVWMDSAAFYIIQHTAALRGATWAGAVTLWGNAATHLVAGIAAGVWLDRGGRVPVVVVATAALAVACAMLGGWFPAWVPPQMTYTVGVSLYSTVLVEVPARTARAGVAAAVFAIAGWAGSALGIGMAQDLARVPPAFVFAATAVVFGMLALRARVVRGALAVAVGMAAGTSSRANDEDPAVARGREVYMAEGCIHCHSQFLRPRTAHDVVRWGPGQTIAEALAPRPPLFGTRRQGPDLLRVGNRRTPEWNRLHLISPQSISPGSRMPAYAHLFRAGDRRGDDLLAYLASLGRGTEAARQAQVVAWRPSAEEPIASAEAARRFAQLCAHCHGAEGRGDGPMAARLSLRPPDWTTDGWRRVPANEELELALSRIIKFGLPGAPMAGHEYLPDRDVVGLARHVQALHKAERSATVAAPR